jgi:AcrR family transcriptional regulator
VARPSKTHEKRRELIPLVAKTFADLGYRKATTAELARRCGVQENILYRLWPDKQGMFIAAIAFVVDMSLEVWREVLAEGGDERTAAERLLAYEAEHHGEFGHYRIVFAALGELDDAEVRAALAEMYRRFQKFIREQIRDHRDASGDETTVGPDAALRAWSVVGLSTVANIGRELGLFSEPQRQRLFAEVGRLLLDGEN